MIEEIELRKLNKKLSGVVRFHKDLNVVTGRNGSGKTTLLKLIWYIISGNIERISREISVEYVRLKTHKYEIEIEFENNELAKISYTDAETAEKETENLKGKESSVVIDKFNKIVAKKIQRSLFFPTFRRIEGGFAMNDKRMVRSGPRGEVYNEESSIQDYYQLISDKVSVYEHKLICSISTQDIVMLLSDKYSGITDRLNKEYTKLSTSIIERIALYESKNVNSEKKGLRDARTVLSEIQDKVNQLNKLREGRLKPFAVLSKHVELFFEKQGIKISDSISLGGVKDRIDSSHLSAGEKQVLSFLSYNAFYDHTPIFIDEPELSLHIDWQRTLLPALVSQETNNQFIIATHSPFIYTKYQDKEIVLNQTKALGE